AHPASFQSNGRTTGFPASGTPHVRRQGMYSLPGRRWPGHAGWRGAMYWPLPLPLLEVPPFSRMIVWIPWSLICKRNNEIFGYHSIKKQIYTYLLNKTHDRQTLFCLKTCAILLILARLTD